MSLFYRVLYSSEHFADWNADTRTSFHHITPGIWMGIWQRTRSQAPDHYPRSTVSGCFTERALDNFLRSAAAHQSVAGWNDIEVRASSELDGLCAFNSAQGLIDWFEPTAFPSVVVAFAGEYRCEAPDGRGAVVARFIREIQRWPWNDFEAAFGSA